MESLVILDGSTFFVSDARGDTAGTEAEGFFHADVRHLSTWQLLVDGAPIRVLTSRTLEGNPRHARRSPRTHLSGVRQNRSSCEGPSTGRDGSSFRRTHGWGSQGATTDQVTVNVVLMPILKWASSEPSGSV